MDSLRYWVTEMHVDGFRFDLAPALAREAFDVDREGRSSTPSTRSLSWPGQADRGAVGYRRERLPSRAIPHSAGRNGTASTVIASAASGVARGQVAELAYRLTGSQRPLRADGRATVRQHQFRHRPRRLHPARPRQLQPQAQRGERRENRDGGNDNNLLELRRARAQPTTEIRRSARQIAELPGHAAPLPGCPDAPAAATNRPHPARQQQRLLPGQRCRAWYDWSLNDSRDDALHESTRQVIVACAGATSPAPPPLSCVRADCSEPRGRTSPGYAPVEAR